MKIAIIDCFSGISGDMTLAALIELLQMGIQPGDFFGNIRSVGEYRHFPHKTFFIQSQLCIREQFIDSLFQLFRVSLHHNRASGVDLFEVIFYCFAVFL